MSYLHEAYHESNDLTEYDSTANSTGEAVAASSDDPYAGTYHGKSTGNGGGGSEYAFARFEPVAGYSELYARCYVKIPTTGLADSGDYAHIIRLRAGTDYLATLSLFYDTDTLEWAVQHRDGASYVWTHTVEATEHSSYVCVELYWLNHATAGICDVYVAGSRIYNKTGLDTADYGNCDEISFGYNANNAGVWEVRWDNAIVDDAYIGLDAPSGAPGAYFKTLMEVLF